MLGYGIPRSQTSNQTLDDQQRQIMGQVASAKRHCGTRDDRPLTADCFPIAEPLFDQFSKPHLQDQSVREP